MEGYSFFNEAIAAYKNLWFNYANFNGRTSRREYWLTILANIVVNLIISIISSILDINILSNIYSIAVFIPSLAIGARRLHDINRSAHWLWLELTGIGSIVLLIFFCQKGVDEGTRF